MTKRQLEHIIRAAGSITDERVILVLGSQSILGSVEHAPEKLLVSIEADVFPISAPDKMELINGSIGEISQFHETFGYYAHGIPPESCPLPVGWETRLHPISNENTSGITGLCLNVCDLACSKLAPGRAKNLDFVTEILANGIVPSRAVAASIKALVRSEDRVAAERSLQIIEHRVKYLEGKEIGDIQASPNDPTIGTDHDELSL